jgi:hypothetical protein
MERASREVCNTAGTGVCEIYRKIGPFPPEIVSLIGQISTFRGSRQISFQLRARRIRGREEKVPACGVLKERSTSIPRTDPIGILSISVYWSISRRIQVNGSSLLAFDLQG